MNPDPHDYHHTSHLVDLFSVLHEENWQLLSDQEAVNNTPGVSDMTAVFQYRGGSEYDRITIRTDRSQSDNVNVNTYVVIIPMPTTTGAYRVRIGTAMDVYKYVDNFIEYYADHVRRID